MKHYPDVRISAKLESPLNAAERRLFFNISSINSFCFISILLFGFVLFSPVSIFAETLAEYRADVKASNTLIQNLLYPDDEDSTFDDFAKLERELLKQIRRRIPASEKIEWQGATVETNNRWLVEKLDKFEQTPETDDKRWDVLTEVGERLEAITEKLDELENPAAATRTKDEDKRKLAEILRREEYQKPVAKDESWSQKIQRKIEEWLLKMFPRPNVSPSSSAGFESFSFVLQMLLYALILGVIGFVIYRFAPFFVKQLRGREKREQKERVILGERLAADETAQNLFAEAENLARAGNLRGAIRQGYIALLCDLSDKKIIGLSQNKTNRDYLRDVRRQNELYQNMSGLTVNYERHWYGFDEAEAADWENFRNGYQKAVGGAEG
ncbi:MAG: hypothetical protein LH472_08025 [Pyrinomonadaceae bacterium]|nr:hypothetical protein [Pyrinomonadaceae bacterium]